MSLLLKGAVIGFSIAAPVGPIGVLCIRRALAEGRLVGLASGLGAATADAFYGSVAGFGLTLVSGFLVRQASWLRIVGGLFLLYLGVRTFLAQPAEDAGLERTTGVLAAYASTFALTITNPMTILSFAAVFVGLGLGTTDNETWAAVLLVLGVFTGSALWWFLLSWGASLLRERVTPKVLVWVNRVSGLIILIFAGTAIASWYGRLGG